MKPIKAVDADLDKIKFPVIVLPKIDGVRGLNVDGKLVGRSGKPFPNKINSDFYSLDIFKGLDGELVVPALKGPTVCSETTGAMRRIDGDDPIVWMIFDDFSDDSLPYEERLAAAKRKVYSIIERYPQAQGTIFVVPSTLIKTREELDEVLATNVEQGFEGSIIRDPKGVYKHGRSTVSKGEYLRVKGFKDAEILVTELKEGHENTNKKTIQSNGKMERSTHQENMVPNGLVGTLIGEVQEDIVCPMTGRTVLAKGESMQVAPGKMSHEKRAHYLANPNELIGELAKFQYFPIGMKDKPRFPTFQSIRAKEDMS